MKPVSQAKDEEEGTEEIVKKPKKRKAIDLDSDSENEKKRNFFKNCP